MGFLGYVSQKKRVGKKIGRKNINKKNEGK